MKFFENILLSLKRALNFNDKATFCEFWSFIIFNIIIFLILYFLNFIYVIKFEYYFFIMILPFFAVFSRRFRDIGISIFFVFLPIILFIISIFVIFNFVGGDGFGKLELIFNYFKIFLFFTFIQFILACLPSKQEKNQVNQTNQDENKSEDQTKNL